VGVGNAQPNSDSDRHGSFVSKVAHRLEVFPENIPLSREREMLRLLIKNINVGLDRRIAPKDDIYDLIFNKTGSAGVELVFVNSMYRAEGRASLRPCATYVIAIQVYANPARQEV